MEDRDGCIICYMYLDDDLIDIEHLCCLANVRAKFEKAERQGCKEASLFMCLIRKLYHCEDLYVEKGYDAEKIKEMRNDEYTRGIVDKRDRQCTIPLSRLASKSESRSDNTSRLCSKQLKLVEQTMRTCYR